MIDAVRWDYRVITFKNYEVDSMQHDLNEWGRAGWELVGLSTTVKKIGTLLGNDLIAVFKRPGVGELQPEPQVGGVEGWI